MTYGNKYHYITHQIKTAHMTKETQNHSKHNKTWLDLRFLWGMVESQYGPERVLWTAVNRRKAHMWAKVLLWLGPVDTLYIQKICEYMCECVYSCSCMCVYLSRCIYISHKIIYVLHKYNAMCKYHQRTCKLYIHYLPNMCIQRQTPDIGIVSTYAHLLSAQER